MTLWIRSGVHAQRCAVGEIARPHAYTINAVLAGGSACRLSQDDARRTGRSIALMALVVYKCGATARQAARNKRVCTSAARMRVRVRCVMTAHTARAPPRENAGNHVETRVKSDGCSELPSRLQCAVWEGACGVCRVVAQRACLCERSALVSVRCELAAQLTTTLCITKQIR